MRIELIKRNFTLLQGLHHERRSCYHPPQTGSAIGFCIKLLKEIKRSVSSHQYFFRLKEVGITS